MRVVSFVKHLELVFKGNVFKNAICLGDVDNDGLNELIVGNEKGELAIFKGDSTIPFYKKECTDFITAIVVGDLCNINRNVLVVITNCGYCYILDFNRPSENDLKPPFIHFQRIPANIKTALIGDVNGDGYLELVVAMTDRVVRTYSWLNSPDQLDAKSQERLISLNKWELSDQIGTISFNKADKNDVLLVAQPGGSYFTLNCNESIMSADPQYHSLASSRPGNPNIQTELYGNIKFNSNTNGKACPFAIAKLDGTLMLVHDDNIKWILQVDHQLFALSSMDITGDGNEELIACAWDGNTYIVSHNADYVQYTFPEPVNSFTAGTYGLNGKETSVLVYVTLSGRIFLYYDIQIRRMELNTLTDVLKNDSEYLKLIEEFGISVDDTIKLREFHSKMLFDYKS